MFIEIFLDCGSFFNFFVVKMLIFNILSCVFLLFFKLYSVVNRIGLFFDYVVVLGDWFFLFFIVNDWI